MTGEIRVGEGENRFTAGGKHLFLTGQKLWHKTSLVFRQGKRLACLGHRSSDHTPAASEA